LLLLVFAAVVACIVGVVALRSGSNSQTLPLELVANVPLPGPSNRFDYASIDQRTKTLYIAHMNAGKLLAFDLRRRSVTRTIEAPGVHGVIAVPSVQRVYASATDARQLLTIDSLTGRILRRAPAGDYPDGLAYDPVERRVFVSDESGGIEAVFSSDGRRTGTVELGGEAGNVQYDAGSGRILVDVQTLDELAVVDPRANRVVRRVELPGCDHPHGLSLDSRHRLAFIACAGNARLLTLDLGTMKVTGHASIGSDPDVLAFDRSLKRLYVAAESGVVAVFSVDGRRLTKLGQDKLAPSAHTVAVDPASHLVYFPLEKGSRGGPELRVLRP
jgi:DNA-binding beta-propeller fold protein YncE